MGRPGRSSSGTGRSSSSGSRRTSSRSHSSSSSSRSTSSRSYSSSHNSYNGGTYHNSSHYHNHHNHHNHHYNNHNNHYYGPRRTGLLSGLLNRIISTVVVLVIFVVILSGSAISSLFGGTNKVSLTNIDEKTVEQYADNQYSKLFNDESHLLLVYAYLDRNETDTATLSFGYDSSELISSDLEDYFWNRYEINYSSNLNESEWLGNTFKETAEYYNDTEKLNSLSKFDKNCYKDNLGWIKSNEKDALINGCESFYNKTGIQPYILLINYEDIPGVVVNDSSSNSNFGFVVIIAIVGLVIAIVIKRIVKMKIDQKNKEQEDLEKTLNTPLEKYSDDLVDKYQ